MKEFFALGLSQPLVDAVAQLGFERPTAIQSQAIPRLLQDDTDFIGLAQTGTGKTAAFGLPIVERVDVALPYIQALILAPTRELCLQISRELEQFGRFRKGLRVQAVYGGASIAGQLRDLRQGPQIVAATPGRLRDMMQRKAVTLTHLQYLVLDEADEMLNMGFKEEIDDILQHTPEDKQTWLFSATMPAEVRRISQDYMEDPFELTIGDKNSSNADIDHQFVLVRPADRYEALKRFLDHEDEHFSLVFCRTRRDTSEVAEQLNADGYPCEALHGDMDQRQRDRVMARFRDRKIRTLIATDVAARGIDVDNISHVFHYNIPEDLNFYTHRSGRTGRAGSKGISLILAHPKDRNLIKQLEKRLKVSFTPVTIPSSEAIYEKKILDYFKKLAETPIRPEAEALLSILSKELAEYSREELILQLASLRLKKFARSGALDRDLNAGSKKQQHTDRNGNFKKLFINVGKIDLGGKGEFINFLCSTGKISGEAIGKIEMQTKHTFFQLEGQFVAQVVRAFDNATLEGRPLRVNEDGYQPKKKGGKKKKKWQK